jgi:hypothetical protein
MVEEKGIQGAKRNGRIKREIVMCLTLLSRG